MLEIVEEECGGVPHKAVQGCPPTCKNMHGLKDHARSKKSRVDDDDDDDDDESGTMNRLLHSFLEKTSGRRIK